MSQDHDHDHDHGGHGHDHDDHAEPVAAPVPAAALRARAIEQLLVEKGVLTRETVVRGIDWLVSRTPTNGARIVARAWVDPAYKATPQRAIVFELEAWDVNCRQHIVARYCEAEIAPAVNKLVARIKELEEEVEKLKKAES